MEHYGDPTRRSVVDCDGLVLTQVKMVGDLGSEFFFEVDRSVVEWVKRCSESAGLVRWMVDQLRRHNPRSVELEWHGELIFLELPNDIASVSPFGFT